MRYLISALSLFPCPQTWQPTPYVRAKNAVPTINDATVVAHRAPTSSGRALPMTLVMRLPLPLESMRCDLVPSYHVLSTAGYLSNSMVKRAIRT